MFDIDIRTQDVPAVCFMSCKEGEFRWCVSEGIDTWIRLHTRADAPYRQRMIDPRKLDWINHEDRPSRAGFEGVFVRRVVGGDVEYSIPLSDLGDPRRVVMLARTVEQFVAMMNGMDAPAPMRGEGVQLLFMSGWYLMIRNCALDVRATPTMARFIAAAAESECLADRVTTALHDVQRIMWPARESSRMHRMIVRTHGGIELHVGNDCVCLCSDRVSLHDREVQGWEAASHNFDHAHHMIQALVCLAQLETLARKV